MQIRTAQQSQGEREALVLDRRPVAVGLWRLRMLHPGNGRKERELHRQERGVQIMWSYEKKLQYPVNIKTPNPKLAQMIITQYGGTYIKSDDFTLKKYRPCSLTG